MAVICRNCGGTLVFDPESQKMICNRCGSLINPAEVEFYGRDVLENKQVFPLSKVVLPEFYDDSPAEYYEKDSEYEEELLTPPPFNDQSETNDDPEYDTSYEYADETEDSADEYAEDSEADSEDDPEDDSGYDYEYDSADETDDPESILRDPSESRKEPEDDSDYELYDPPPLLKDIPEPIRNFAKRNFAKWDFSDNYMECAVYTCDYCGGEVIVNGTEASTMCIFCGNPVIVFSRIAKQRRPELIVPFKITKKDALKAIRKHFNKGIFIPREVKHFKEKQVRGIYIPYWIADAEHYGSAIILGSVEKSKSGEPDTYYYGRAGTIMIRDFPVDASRILPYDISSRLEPYGIRNATEFNEDYLAGFYSSIADDSFDGLSDLIEKRAAAIFEEEAKADIMNAYPERIIEAVHHTEIDYGSLRYAMLPAWFVIYEHKGKHNTILVNGETGKVVCGVPWNKALLIVLYTLFALLMSAAGILIEYVMLEQFMQDIRILEALVVLIFIDFIMFKLGIKDLKKISKSLGLTQSRSVFNFVKRRQG